MLVRKPARCEERDRPNRLAGTTTMKPTHLRLDAVSCSIASAILVPNRSDAVQVRGPGGRLPASSVAAAGDGLGRIATLDLVRGINFLR
jgi:hypothetical protein